MKKILVFIILLLIIVLNCGNAKKDFSLKEYFPDGELTLYSNICHENDEQILHNVYITQNRHSIIGESIFLNNIEIGQAIKQLDAKVLLTEQVDDITIIFCFSSKINSSVEYKGFTINLQIADSPNRTIIGWPMILGGF